MICIKVAGRDNVRCYSYQQFINELSKLVDQHIALTYRQPSGIIRNIFVSVINFHDVIDTYTKDKLCADEIWRIHQS